MLRTLAIVLLLSVASADYLAVGMFSESTCGGSATARAGMNSYQFIAGCSVTGGFASQLSCVPGGANVTTYQGTTCTGPGVFSQPLTGLTFGACVSVGDGSYSRASCVSGAYSAPSSAIIVNGYSTATCPATGAATNTIAYTTNACLSLYGQNVKITCSSASAGTVNSYAGPGCTGTMTPLNAASLGFSFGCTVVKNDGGQSYSQTAACTAPFATASGARAGAGVAAAAGAAAGAALLALAARA